MPEYVLSKVLGGAIIMGRREYLYFPPSGKKAPLRTLLRTYSGILPKRHGILVERN